MNAVGLPLLALLVSFAGVLGLGSAFALRESPASASANVGPTPAVVIQVYPDRLSDAPITPFPDTEIRRTTGSSTAGESGGTAALCVRLPNGWRVDGAGWIEQSEPIGDHVRYCLPLDPASKQPVDLTLVAAR
jgi:hypothetical protein